MVDEREENSKHKRKQREFDLSTRNQIHINVVGGSRSHIRTGYFEFVQQPWTKDERGAVLTTQHSMIRNDIVISVSIK